MKYGKDMLDKIVSNKNKDHNDVILEATKGAYVGSAIGLGLGLFIGYTRNYNLVFSAFIGASIGGLLTKFLINRD